MHNMWNLVFPTNPWIFLACLPGDWWQTTSQNQNPILIKNILRFVKYAHHLLISSHRAEFGLRNKIHTKLEWHVHAAFEAELQLVCNSRHTTDKSHRRLKLSPHQLAYSSQRAVFSPFTEWRQICLNKQPVSNVTFDILCWWNVRKIFCTFESNIWRGHKINLNWQTLCCFFFL